jgi:hypothetical protein
MVKPFLLFCILLLTCLSCVKNHDEEDLKAIQSILHGIWHIQECHIPKYGSGVYIGGEIVKKDTLLYGMGDLDIPEFNIFNLDLNSQIKDTLVMTFIYKDERIPVLVPHLFLAGREYVAYFRGTTFLETEGEKFVNSRYPFRQNYLIEVVDRNHIMIKDLQSRSDVSNYMVLKRK